ncbi:hypothetical protein HDU84_006923 [Entophlyctis sp. JEL0112]|nr:hypothetical protein HDU84_006923 [Entophlyctis sp. JEL0112]
MDVEETSLLFYVRTGLLIPTLLLGALLCVAVLTAHGLFRRILIARTLDRVVVLLLAVVLVWAASSLLYFSFNAFAPSLLTPAYSRVDAALSYTCVVWLVTANLLLALSRMFIFKELPDESTTVYYRVILFISGVISVTLFAVCFSLTDPPSRFGIASIGTEISPRVVIGLSLTYMQISRNLAKAWTSNLELRIRLLLQKKALKSCTAMSLGTVVSYLPLGLALLISQALPNKLRSFPDWLIVVLSELAVLDTVLTPIMVLVFVPKVRLCLLKLVRIIDHEISTDEDTDHQESMELAVAD